MNTGSLEGKKKSQTTQTQTKATWGLGIIWGADIGGSMGQRRAGGGGPGSESPAPEQVRIFVEQGRRSLQAH